MSIEICPQHPESLKVHECRLCMRIYGKRRRAAKNANKTPKILKNREVKKYMDSHEGQWGCEVHSHLPLVHKCSECRNLYHKLIYLNVTKPVKDRLQSIKNFISEYTRSARKCREDGDVIPNKFKTDDALCLFNLLITYKMATLSKITEKAYMEHREAFDLLSLDYC